MANTPTSSFSCDMTQWTVPSDKERAFALHAARKEGAHPELETILAETFLDEINNPWCCAIEIDGTLVARIGGNEHGENTLYFVVHGGRPVGISGQWKYGFDADWVEAVRRKDTTRLHELGIEIVDIALHGVEACPLALAGAWSLSTYNAKMRSHLGLHGTSNEMDKAKELVSQRLRETGGELAGTAIRGSSCLRWSKGLAKGRSIQLLARAERVLKQVRSRIDPQIVSTLWAIHVHDARYASWVLMGNMNYRIQALRAQPVLLPLALDKMFGLGAKLGRQDSKIKENVYQIERAIDDGKPWVEPLTRALGNPQNYTEQSGFDDRVRTTRWMAGRGVGKMLSMAGLASNWSGCPLELFGFAHRLSNARRPKSRKDWLIFARLIETMNATSMDGILREPTTTKFSLDVFLKGTPMNWAEPEWENIIQDIRSIHDTQMWLRNSQAFGNPHRERNVFIEARLTLMQWRGFSRRIHNGLANMMREEEERQETEYGGKVGDYSSLSWPAVSPKATWKGKEQDIEIRELTTAGELQHEGTRLLHCVGGYAKPCLLGHCRIFSVRNYTSGASSTFEVRPKPPSGRPVLVQHKTYRNQQPGPDEARAVAVFMRWLSKNHNFKSIRWPVMPIPPGMGSGQQNLTNTQAFFDYVRNEMTRSYPKVAEKLRAASANPVGRGDENLNEPD